MKKQKLLKKLAPLIQGCIFLEEDVKIKLLDNLDRFSDEDLQELKTVFDEAKGNQNGLIDKIVAYDKTFVPRLKQWKRKETRKEFKRYEKAQRKDEAAEKLLKKLRNE